MLHVKRSIRDRYKLRQIMDDTGDETTEDKVIIERYGQPPIVVFTHQIEETLEPYADVTPDRNYREFHTEIQRAWDNDLPWRESFEREIGVLIERLTPNHYDKD